jgi:hypothetical protein
VAQKVGEELGPGSLLFGEVSTRGDVLMPTVTLVTSVFLSKAEALAVLEEVLEAPWNIDDPSDVTLPLDQGVAVSIEIPKFGEDLPLTLDLHHAEESVLREVADQVTHTLETTLGWSIHEIPRGEVG